jgi:predicted transposase YdaD
MGLKYERELAGKLLQGVRAMKESVTYQQILEEGEARGEVRGEARGTLNSILRVGSKRFGEPPAPIRAALARIDDVGRLQTFLDRLLEISCWDELLNER